MSISIDAEKESDEIQHPIMKKRSLIKVGIEGSIRGQGIEGSIRGQTH